MCVRASLSLSLSLSLFLRVCVCVCVCMCVCVYILYPLTLSLSHTHTHTHRASELKARRDNLSNAIAPLELQRAIAEAVQSEDFIRAAALKAQRDTMLAGGGTHELADRTGAGGHVNKADLTPVRERGSHGSVLPVVTALELREGGLPIAPRSPSMLISAEDLGDGDEGGG